MSQDVAQIQQQQQAGTITEEQVSQPHAHAQAVSRARALFSRARYKLSLHARTRRGVQGVRVELAGTAAGGTAETHVHGSGGGHAAALLPAAATPTAGLSICVHVYVSACMFLSDRALL